MTDYFNHDDWMRARLATEPEYADRRAQARLVCAIIGHAPHCSAGNATSPYCMRGCGIPYYEPRPALFVAFADAMRGNR